MQFDIKEYKPLITEQLLYKAITFSNINDVKITTSDVEIIKNARKAFLFSETNGERITWHKKMDDDDENDKNLGMTMGAPDGVEVCELVGPFLLSKGKVNPLR